MVSISWKTVVETLGIQSGYYRPAISIVTFKKCLLLAYAFVYAPCVHDGGSDLRLHRTSVCRLPIASRVENILTLTMSFQTGLYD